MSAESSVTIDGASARQPLRRARHASQGASKLVASGPTQTCWRLIMPRAPSSSRGRRELTLPAPARATSRRSRTAEDELMTGAATREPDVGVECNGPLDVRIANSLEKRGSHAAGAFQTWLTEARERGLPWLDPHDRLARRSLGAHAAALASCWGARSANFANRFRNASFSVPIGPLRCLARMISASPWSSDCSL
jgi:hypothetical protein